MLVLALAAAAALAPEFQPMAFLVDHCWRATFQNGQQDTHCFMPALGGRHVRDLHQVIAGGKTVYEGETLYSWNGRTVSFIYFDSEGGTLRGAMTARPGWLDFGNSEYSGHDGKTFVVSTRWRIVNDKSYEAMTSSANRPTAEQAMLYQRLD